MTEKSFEDALANVDKSIGSGPGSSSGSGSSGYPKFRELVPILAIVDDGSGPELQKRPDDYRVYEWKKDKETPYQFHSADDEIVNFWLERSSVDLLLHRWKQLTDVDFWKLAEDDMEQLISSLEHLDSIKGPVDEVCKTEKCPVCRKENHVVLGDYVKMKGRRVCRDHTAEEIVKSEFVRQNRNRKI